jgi:hypothetical protein
MRGGRVDCRRLAGQRFQLTDGARGPPWRQFFKELLSRPGSLLDIAQTVKRPAFSPIGKIGIDALTDLRPSSRD